MPVAGTTRASTWPRGPARAEEGHCARHALLRAVAGRTGRGGPGGTDHRVYVMQCYCHIVDATVDEQTLATLGQRLHLPAGWSYHARQLDAELNVRTVGSVTVQPPAARGTEAAAQSPSRRPAS